MDNWPFCPPPPLDPPIQWSLCHVVRSPRFIWTATQCMRASHKRRRSISGLRWRPPATWHCCGRYRYRAAAAPGSQIGWAGSGADPVSQQIPQPPPLPIDHVIWEILKMGVGLSVFGQLVLFCQAWIGFGFMTWVSKRMGSE